MKSKIKFHCREALKHLKETDQFLARDHKDRLQEIMEELDEFFDEVLEEIGD